MTTVSIVIPHADDPHLAALLDSLRPQMTAEAQAHFKVVLVDDCSTPSYVAGLVSLKASCPWLELKVQPTRLGPAAARNRGARETQSEWLWFLDADVVLAGDALQAVQRLLSTNLGIDAITTAASPLPLAARGFARHKAYFGYLWQPPEGPTRTIDSKSFLVRRSTFEAAGGFDPNFKTPTVEDYDLCRRLLTQNARLYFSAAVPVQHHEPDFRTEWRLFYRRSRDWMRLKLGSGFGFDDNGSSASEAVLYLVGLATLIFPPAGIVLVALSWQRLRFLRRTGEPLTFLVAHLLCICLLSLPIMAGALAGLAKGAFRHRGATE